MKSGSSAASLPDEMAEVIGGKISSNDDRMMLLMGRVDLLCPLPCFSLFKLRF